MKSNIVQGKEIIFPSVPRESVYSRNPLTKDPKEYVSNQGYNYYDDGNFQWWRNLRFGIVSIHVNVIKKEICCKISHNNKTISYMFIKDKKMVYKHFKKNIYKQGLKIVAAFLNDVYRLDYITRNNEHCMDKVRKEVYNVISKYLLEVLQIKSFYNVYHPLVDLKDDYPHKVYSSAISSKYQIWNHLRDTTRLKDLTYLIFQTKGNKYTKLVQTILQDYDYGSRLNVIYMLVKYFKVKKEHILKIYNSNYKTALISYEFTKFDWRTLKKLFNKLKIDEDVSILTDIVMMYSYIDGTRDIGIDPKDMAKKIKDKNMKVSEVHDLITAVYNSINKRKYYYLPEYPELEGKLKNGYVVTYPKSSEELLKWGQFNSFCVGSYDKSILNGQCIILGLWKNNELICAEFIQNTEEMKLLYSDLFKLDMPNKFFLNQIKGKYNSQVDEEIVNLLKKYMEDKEKAYPQLNIKKVKNIEDNLMPAYAGKNTTKEVLESILKEY